MLFHLLVYLYFYFYIPFLFLFHSISKRELSCIFLILRQTKAALLSLASLTALCLFFPSGKMAIFWIFPVGKRHSTACFSHHPHHFPTISHHFLKVVGKWPKLRFLFPTTCFHHFTLPNLETGWR